MREAQNQIKNLGKILDQGPSESDGKKYRHAALFPSTTEKKRRGSGLIDLSADKTLASKIYFDIYRDNVTHSFFFVQVSLIG